MASFWSGKGDSGRMGEDLPALSLNDLEAAYLNKAVQRERGGKS